MLDHFRRNPEGVIGAGLGFLLSGFGTSTLGFCGQDFLTCLSVHPSAAPLTQFAGELMIGVGLSLVAVSLPWVHRRDKDANRIETTR
jgi:hypothetical protein